MRKLRSWLVLLSAIGLTTGGSLVVSDPALAYSPGNATAYRPTYNASRGGWNYHCSFTGWRSGAKVTWHCNLYARFINDLGFPEDSLIAPHSGSWTPGSSSYTTTTYYNAKQLGVPTVCTKAWALSVDGGTNTKIACNL